MNKKRIVIATVAVLLIGAVGGATFAMRAPKGPGDEAKKKGPPALEFSERDITRVTPSKLNTELSLPGTVMAVSQATVRAKLSAEVRRVLVREGDRVTAGQVVAEFDTAQLKVQLAERTASLESARAQMAQAERTRQANAQLVKQSFISQNAFDTADASYRAQAAAVEAATAQLEQTRLLLNDAQVRAPISGHVSRRNVQPGEKVGFDAPLMSIVDLSQLEVQVQSPVSDVAQVTSGASVEVAIEGLARSYTGRVDRVNPAAEPGSRTINFYVALKNEDAQLRAGMFAKVRLRAGEGREVPALPMSALRDENGQQVVWVVKDGKLAKRIVTLGRRDERAQLVEITSGLASDERVLATKFDNLREGQVAKVISGLGADSKVADKDLPRSPAAAN